MLVDTHAHLWWDSYTDLDDVITRAQDAGVEKMVMPGTDLISSKKAIELVQKYPGVLSAAVGIHPEETINKTLAVTMNALMFNAQIKKLRELVDAHKERIVAIGEIGTDANTEELRQSMNAQMELMREQCEIALDYDLPVIIHTRKSIHETLRVLDSLPHMPRGQFHCFSYDEPEVQDVLSRGFFISFCGNITWSKRVQRTSLLVPLDRLLLETDSPLMIPRDKNGQPVGVSLRNEPKNVTILAQIQAELRSILPAELATQTTANARSLFGI